MKFYNIYLQELTLNVYNRNFETTPASSIKFGISSYGEYRNLRKMLYDVQEEYKNDDGFIDVYACTYGYYLFLCEHKYIRDEILCNYPCCVAKSGYTLDDNGYVAKIKTEKSNKSSKPY